jgi:hypothetical protein
MGMTRATLLLALVLVIGCNKPSKEDCRKAIENMRSLMHTTQVQTDVEGEVRRCNGGSKREAVACAIKATTLDELRGCKFMTIPAEEPATEGSAGSAMGAPGSAAPAGSADSAGSSTGSAGSTMGSAGSTAPAGSADSAGSATGSAATGSAGSATGSATGSAGSAATGSGSAAP